MDGIVTPAERLAALKAIAHGLDAAIDHAERAVLAQMGQTGADRFRTKLGPVSKIVRKPTIRFDDDKLIKFAEDVAPWEIETRVRRTFRSQFDVIDGAVIYKPTGEEVDFATVHPGTEGLTTRLSDEAKTTAEDLLITRIESVASLIELEKVDHDE